MIRILIVDDRKTIRASIEALLEPESDIEVIGTASDGLEAIEQVKLLQPDLVLMDIDLPHLDGLRATEVILRNFTGIKVIVLGDYYSQEHANKALDVGATDYMLKSVTAIKLVKSIRLASKLSKQIQPNLVDGEHAWVADLSWANGQKAVGAASESTKTKKSFIKSAQEGLSAGITKYIRPSLKPGKRGNLYLSTWVVGNILLWTTALAYLILKPPTYKSEWTVGLPVGTSTTSINLPEIGDAYSRDDSPFSNSQFSDPRENYKLLARTQEIREAAASELGIALGELGKPEIKILDNTTLMAFEIEGDTPQEAYEKALALQNALEDRLDQLREQEIAQQEWKLQTTLDSSRRQLQEAQRRLSEYKSRVPVSSREQMGNLSTNVETLRRQTAETAAQQQQVAGRLNELSANLGLSVQEAADALVLQSDLLFRQYSADYSRINGELVNLESKFLPANPLVVDKQAEKNETLSALVERGQSLLKKSVSREFLEQLSLNLNNGNSSDSNRASLLQEIISLQAQKEGLQNQEQELEQQIANLENRLSILSPQESTLAELQRNVQIAEAVFSSTMTKLDLSKSAIFASYPRTQVVTGPSLPEEASSPKTIFVLLGSSMGSFFLTTGLFSLWWRDRQNRRAKDKEEEKQLELNMLPSLNHTNNSVLSRK